VNGTISQIETNRNPTIMSDYKFSCPHCSQHLSCDESGCGRQIQCPTCNHLIAIPFSAEKLVAGHKTVERGRTWDTFLPLPTPKI
jgi:hypothetical protein